MNKITIIGTGCVGSTIAYTLTVMGLASEIVMIDINSEKALGEALDIRQGTPFCNPCSIYAGDYRDASGSDIVILTSGIARKPGQTRLELAQTNVNITKMIIPEITKYAPDAIYIIVSNPVDILTYTFLKLSDIPGESPDRLRHDSRHGAPALPPERVLSHQSEQCPCLRPRRARRLFFHPLVCRQHFQRADQGMRQPDVRPRSGQSRAGLR